MSERLWAPWRIGFLVAEPPSGCFLCENPRRTDDATTLILERGQHALVCLNAYPYTAGHLLVAPYRHVGELRALSPDELHECIDLVQLWTGLLQDCLHCEGVNMGINQGKAAGAALGDHVHMHVVPRWLGDHNFMSVASGTRIIHQSLQEAYEMLTEARGNR